MKKIFKATVMLTVIIVLYGCKSNSAPTETVSQNLVSQNITSCVIPELKVGVADNIALLRVRNDDNPFLFTDITAATPDFERLNGSIGTLTGKNTRLDFNDNVVEITHKDNSNISVKYDNFKIIVTIKNTKYLFGFGERFGKMNLMGEDISIEIKNNHKYSNRAIMPLPVLYDSNGSFVYFGSPYIARADIHTEGNTVTISYSNGGNNKDMQGIDLYVGYCDNLISASSQYLKLVGLPPLPPKWAFGYIQSKYGYFTSQQVLKIAHKFNELDIPLTAMVLDLYWFTYMGDIDWNKDNFPDPKALTDELNGLGIKLITISEPFFDKNSKNYKPFDSKKFLAKNKEGKTAYLDNWWGKGGVIDYSNDKANLELWKKCYEPQLKVGVGAFWTDLGEPEGVFARTKFMQGEEATIHNTYNLMWSKGIYLNWLKSRPSERPFILSRSGWTGSPKYGVSVWSGDVKTDWSGMELQPFLMQSVSLGGFSFCGHDVGGFVGEGEPVLYEKWQELGLFSPVHRAHGSDADREPWAFEEEALTETTALLRKRAQFIPYIYSTAYNTCQTGEPFLRPIDSVYSSSLTEQQKDDIISNEYYFGQNIVYRPVYDKTAANVYLPGENSSSWVDLATDKVYVSGKIHNIEYTKGNPSYFLKPTGVFVENADASYTKYDNLTVYVNAYGVGDSTFTLYNDDGVSQDYKNGKCDILDITTSVTKDGINIMLNPVKTASNETRPNLNFVVYADKTLSSDIEISNDKNICKFNINYPNETKVISLK